MRIIIVRHGETDGNANGIIQTPDTPLNERGLAQASAVGARLKDESISHIVASDYARAHMTAQAISGATGLDIEIHPGLRERNFGDLRGKPRSELTEDPFTDHFDPPGGESWPVFHDRVAACWDEVSQLAERVTGDLVVVTHGLVCYSLALNHLHLPGDMAAERGFGNTSVTIADKQQPWSVSLYNCCAHLDEMIEARGSDAP